MASSSTSFSSAGASPRCSAACLPAKEADVLRRRFSEGRSQVEIAADTGVPLGTVKSRMVAGLARLRETLDVRVPVDLSRYRFIDVSVEADDGDPSHSSRSVLRGRT